MRVVVCAIAKNEHNYINEWVKHYLGLGFDHIYLYDNDNQNSPYIGNYIDKKYADKITIFNLRGVKKPYLQHSTYSYFYGTYRNTFKWCFFADIDEFLVGINNVKDFLSQDKFDGFNQIRIKWHLFGDDNIVERDSKLPVLNAFKEIKDNTPISNQGKSFIRGDLFISINSCHYVKGLKSCYPSGKESSKGLDLENYENETIFVNHYITKSLSEFIKQKLNRGDAVWFNRHIDFDYYWKINDKTREKLDYIKNMGLDK